MDNITQFYKEISKKILEILKDTEIDNDKLDEYLYERKVLLENIGSKDKDDFIREYKIYLEEIDKQIGDLLQEKLIDSKRELVKYRQSLNGNKAYVYANKTSLNLFSKKI